MGRAGRPRPARLGEKLLAIRQHLGLSQTEMLKAIGLSGKRFHSAISDYEYDRREPPLPVLLDYARLAGISTDVLIDDKLDLPEGLQSQELSVRLGGRIRSNR